ncbi:MAG: hypothetical protein JNL58_07665 [Planctomyces sp.]|nr:hypothetical protein [Planctomyces sp.]
MQSTNASTAVFPAKKAALLDVCNADREFPIHSVRILWAYSQGTSTSILLCLLNGGSMATSGPVTNSNNSLPQGGTDQQSQATNVAAITGAVISGISVVLYASLLYMVSGLPTQQPELSLLQDNTPVLLRLTLVGSSAVLMNIVSLSIAILALMLPGRSTMLAWIVVMISAILLLGVASVILLSALM